MDEYEFMHKELFDKIENKINIKATDIFALADSVKNANFGDETIVRQLVRSLSTLANIPVTEDIENSIVDSFTIQDERFAFRPIGKVYEKN